MTGIVAVHCGAGYHNPKHYTKYNQLAKKACITGIEALHNGQTALEAVEAMVIILENNSLTNAGFGSNLTSTGFVEGDASLMDGATLTYGGCGAIQKVKNPIKLAYDVCVKQSKGLSLGRIPPSLLVGTGGLMHARNVGLPIVSNRLLVSVKALKQYRKYKKWLDDGGKQPAANSSSKLDTVGAVCMDNAGRVAAACSSGGILLKHPGRVGQAALYGCGTWADSFAADEPSVAVCTTGCGEHLVQTQLAKAIADDLKVCDCPTIGLNKSMTENFMDSRYLRNVPLKLCGALALHADNKTGDVSVLWGHSTKSMGVGYMRTIDQKPKAMISQLPSVCTIGATVNVGGTYFYHNIDGAAAAT